MSNAKLHRRFLIGFSLATTVVVAIELWNVFVQGDGGGTISIIMLASLAAFFAARPKSKRKDSSNDATRRDG